MAGWSANRVPNHLSRTSVGYKKESAFARSAQCELLCPAVRRLLSIQLWLNHLQFTEGTDFSVSQLWLDNCSMSRRKTMLAMNSSGSYYFLLTYVFRLSLPCPLGFYPKWPFFAIETIKNREKGLSKRPSEQACRFHIHTLVRSSRDEVLSYCVGSSNNLFCYEWQRGTTLKISTSSACPRPTLLVKYKPQGVACCAIENVCSKESFAPTWSARDCL